MQAAYGLDPADLTLRRLWVLLHRLPPGAWNVEDSPHSWSTETWMLANIVDALNQVAWIVLATNSKKRPKRPKPFPRPGVKQKKGGLAGAMWAVVEAQKKKGG